MVITILKKLHVLQTWNVCVHLKYIYIPPPLLPAHIHRIHLGSSKLYDTHRINIQYRTPISNNEGKILSHLKSTDPTTHPPTPPPHTHTQNSF